MRLGDIQIEYRHLPGIDNALPTLILLHEGLGSVAQWRDFPVQLQEVTGCPVVAYSRKGYGNSSPIALPRALDYLSNEGPKELGQIIAALGLERIVLVGHSDGASIALSYASINDRRVQGTVALAPHVIVEPLTITKIRLTTAQWNEGHLRERLTYHHGTNVFGAFHGWSDSWLSADFSLASLAAQLPSITTPLLVIQGRDDQYGTLEQLKVINGLVSARCRCVLLDNCQHFPQREAPAQTLQLIKKFVGELAE